jgi:hypothetical protein
MFFDLISYLLNSSVTLTRHVGNGDREIVGDGEMFFDLIFHPLISFNLHISFISL